MYKINVYSKSQHIYNTIVSLWQFVPTINTFLFEWESISNLCRKINIFVEKSGMDCHFSLW